MFILFNGEAYDYIGSSRMVYDMLNDNFPNDIIKFNQSHIGLFVELSQIHYDKEVVFHRSIKYNVCIYIENELFFTLFVILFYFRLVKVSKILLVHLIQLLLMKILLLLNRKAHLFHLHHYILF